MADEKLNTGPAENTSPEAAGPITTPEQAAASEPQQEQTGPAIPESGDVVVSFDKINELMAEKRQNARAEVEKAETPETPEAAAPGETPQPANTEEPKKPRRGRPPKAEKAATENQKAEKSAGARKGRPPKADKAAPDKPKPSKRDKVSRSDGKAPDAKEPIKPAQDTALKETAAVEQTAPEPTTPPRPVEEGKLVYLKLSEVHPFHTFRPHPFKVRDDAKMQEIVASIRVNGVMVPGLARPEKDGNGYGMEKRRRSLPRQTLILPSKGSSWHSFVYPSASVRAVWLRRGLKRRDFCINGKTLTQKGSPFLRLLKGVTEHET